MMKKIIFFTIVLVAISSCNQRHNSKTTESIPVLSENEKLEIETMARELPMKLANNDWDSYEDHFSDRYTNWPMDNNKTRSREEFLGRVKNWYDSGNRPTDSEVNSIDFIPINDSLVIYLKHQKEVFNDPNDSTITRTMYLGSVSIYQREAGRWKSLFTAFMDVPQSN